MEIDITLNAVCAQGDHMSLERAQAIVDAFDPEFAPTAASVLTLPDELIEYIYPFAGRQVFGVETGVR